MLNRFPNGETDRGNYSERTLVSIQAELEGTEPERDKNKSAMHEDLKYLLGLQEGKGLDPEQEACPGIVGPVQPQPQHRPNDS